MASERSFYFGPTVLLGLALVVPSLIYIGLTDIHDFDTDQSALNFLDKIYFSVVTFTTLGYGDISPVGWVRGVSVLQALFGPISVGYYIYAFGKTVAAREQRNTETQKIEHLTQEKIVSFDKRQGFYRDMFRYYSQLFQNLRLEYSTVFRQNEVFFSDVGSREASVAQSLYYDFERNSVLIGHFFNSNVNEWLRENDLKPFIKVQTLIDLYMSSMQPLISSANVYGDVNDEYIRSAVNSFRSGNDLFVRMLDLKEKQDDGVDLENHLKAYARELSVFLQSHNFNIARLLNRKSVDIVTCESQNMLQYSLEERKAFLDNPYEWRYVKLFTKKNVRQATVIKNNPTIHIH